MLPTTASARQTRFCVRALVQNQHAPRLIPPQRAHFALDLFDHAPSRPRRIAHKVLDVGSVLQSCGGNSAIGALLRHSQHSAQIIVAMRALIAGACPEMRPITTPNLPQTLWQLFYRRAGQPPPTGFQCVFVSSLFVIRSFIAYLLFFASAQFFISNVPLSYYSGGTHFYACNDSRKRKNCRFGFS